MPTAQVWVRGFCYVIFVPWALMLLAAIGMVATGDKTWPTFVAIEAAGLLVIGLGLGAGDIWVANRGHSETVEWSPEQATMPRRTLDSTASATGIADTLAYRHAKGRCVVKLSAPIGPKGKPRMLALRSGLDEVDDLVWVLSGASGIAVSAGAPVSAV